MRITPSDRLNAEIKELHKQDGIFAAVQLQKKEEELRQLRKKHWDQIQGVQGQISKHAKRFSVATEKPYHELRTVAEQGALRAAETFDESFGVKFTTHADRHIRQSMVVWFQQMYVPDGYRNRRSGRDCPIQVNYLSGLKDDDNFSFADKKAVDPAEEVEKRIDQEELLRKVKEVMTPREYSLAFDVLGMKAAGPYVGEKAGISKERVWQILADAVGRVRDVHPDLVVGPSSMDKRIAKSKERKTYHALWQRRNNDKRRYQRNKLKCLSVQAKTLFD